jgi:hypothetical protein
MVWFLLDAGADANETPTQYAPMPLAVDLGLDRILELLLERGADTSYVIQIISILILKGKKKALY